MGLFGNDDSGSASVSSSSSTGTVGDTNVARLTTVLEALKPNGRASIIGQAKNIVSNFRSKQYRVITIAGNDDKKTAKDRPAAAKAQLDRIFTLAAAFVEASEAIGFRNIYQGEPDPKRLARAEATARFLAGFSDGGSTWSNLTIEGALALDRFVEAVFMGTQGLIAIVGQQINEADSDYERRVSQARSNFEQRTLPGMIAGMSGEERERATRDAWGAFEKQQHVFIFAIRGDNIEDMRKWYEERRTFFMNLQTYIKEDRQVHNVSTNTTLNPSRRLPGLWN